MKQFFIIFILALLLVGCAGTTTPHDSTKGDVVKKPPMCKVTGSKLKKPC